MAGLKDVASASGVSIRTVGRALSGTGYVREETRKLVIEAAEKLGYRPNMAARSLRTQRSYEICILAGSGMDELSTAKVAAFQNRIHHTDYYMTMHFTKDLGDKSALEELLKAQPAGIAVLKGAGLYREDLCKLLSESTVPYIMMDCVIEELDSVRIDRQQGVYESVTFLAGTGRKRIAYAGSLRDRTRIDGYERAIRELGRESLIYEVERLGGRNMYETGRRAGLKIAKSSPRPDAVQAYSDYLAAGILGGLYESGLRVPDDIAIVGFDNRDASEMTWPRLTTVAQPNSEAGENAAAILLSKIEKQPAPKKGWSKTLPTKLVIREST